MLSVTIRSCIEAFKPIGVEKCEIIIADNSDDEHTEVIKSVIPAGYFRDKTIRFYKQPFPCLFTARELAAEKAEGEYIICVDSHMLIGYNTFLDLLTFAEEKAEDPTFAFAHAPISWAHQHENVAKHDRDMSQCELGGWNLKYDSPRTITWKGMPWICRRDWFLSRETGLGGYGALSEHRISWGGGDMHIGVKPWLLGFKNWAVPTSPCIHIGPYPKIDSIPGDPNSTRVAKAQSNDYKYRLWANSGTGPHALGFLISCYVLGGEAMMERNREPIKQRFGRYIDIPKWWDKSIEYGSGERQWLLDRQKMSFKQMLKLRPWEDN